MSRAVNRDRPAPLVESERSGGPSVHEARNELEAAGARLE
jgi:hypothetical protein